MGPFERLGLIGWLWWWQKTADDEQFMHQAWVEGKMDDADYAKRSSYGARYIALRDTPLSTGPQTKRSAWQNFRREHPTGNFNAPARDAARGFRSRPLN